MSASELTNDPAVASQKYTGRYFELVVVGEGKGAFSRYVERTDEIQRLREELRQARGGATRCEER